MYRIVLAATGIPIDEGPPGARCISEDFTHRPWHQNATCEWDGSRIILTAENDFDCDGLALVDEFSDAISACLKDAGDDGSIVVQSITELPTD
jgi:hypothetical protein